MSYWENAEEFCKYNSAYQVSLTTTVRSLEKSAYNWFNVRGGDGMFHNKRIDLTHYFRDWGDQTQKEWDMVCMLFNIPQVYVKQ